MTKQQLFEACREAFDTTPGMSAGINAMIRVVQDDAAESQFPEVDPTRLEATRLAVQWTERHEAVSAGTLLSVAGQVERYLRGEAKS